MDFGTAIKTCFRKYFVFSGRARRSEMWFFFLFTLIVLVVLAFVDSVLFDRPMPFYSHRGSVGFQLANGPLGGIFSLLTFFPWLTVGVRRMHDIGRTGWWWGGLYLAVIILFVTVLSTSPIYGPGPSEGVQAAIGFYVIAMLLWFVVNFFLVITNTKKGHNKYGPDPKYGGVETAFD